MKITKIFNHKVICIQINNLTMQINILVIVKKFN